jgi:hypothetical protein
LTGISERRLNRKEVIKMAPQKYGYWVKERGIKKGGEIETKS